MAHMPQTFYQYIGKDANELPRCYGNGPTADAAETECRKAIIEYIGRRPDTGPISSWTLEIDPGFDR